jgi:dihydroxyacetone kinase phosphotransfer subunit
MVGMVIVSHSSKVAEGIYELAIQMTGDNHSIVTAGGMDDGGIGTDAIMIKDAIEKADKGEGVVILADLGSAILSAQTAIDLLEETELKVIIADAPVLEGAIGAAVQASIGCNLEEVVAAAEVAREILKLL